MLVNRGDEVPKRTIAVEFDSELVPARDLARAVLAVTQLVDAEAFVYTQGFRPTEWPTSEATITIEQES